MSSLPYGGYGVECLRFGSRKGGSGIGCCAIEIMQNFNHSPDAKYTEGLVHGDSLAPLMKGSKQYAVGPTNKDAFLQRLRIGTFGSNELPDRIFLVALNKSQLTGPWMPILKEQGFEFVRKTNNSVYTGSKVNADPSKDTHHSSPVYLFALFRNISSECIEDPFTPPSEWTDLPEPEKSPRELWLEGKTELIFIDPKTKEVCEADDNPAPLPAPAAEFE